MSERKEQVVGIRRRTSVVIIVSFFFMSCIALESATAKMVAVKNDDVNMRSGPSLSEKVMWKLGVGFPLKVLKKSGDWIKVKDFENTVGWVHENVVNRSGHMIVKAQKKNQGKINVRSKPSTKSKVVAKAHYGVVFKTLKQQKGWVKVKHNQVTGWVKRSLLWGF